MQSQDRFHHDASFARARAVKADTFGVLCEALHKVRASRVIDLGCGQGEMATRLAAAGFHMTGLDPSSAALEAARERSREIEYFLGSAEAAPFKNGSFDAAYFLNALHHVPPQHMRKAVLSALDLVHPDGIVVVIEPMATGSFFRAMRPVEDETEIRTQAAHVIDQLIADGEVRLLDLRRWDRENCFASLEDFVDYLVAVDPQRAETVQRNNAQLARAWRENITLRDNRACLMQPLICWTLARR